MNLLSPAGFDLTGPARAVTNISSWTGTVRLPVATFDGWYWSNTDRQAISDQR